MKPQNATREGECKLCSFKNRFFITEQCARSRRAIQTEIQVNLLHVIVNYFGITIIESIQTTEIY